MFKLSETLGKTWVITLPNSEERHWETQLAEFDFEAVDGGKAEGALILAAAHSLAALVRSFPERGWEVTSHIPAHRAAMTAAVESALA